MKGLIRLFKVAVGLAMLLVALFSAYNFGWIASDPSGARREQVALAEQEPYVIYFTHPGCLLCQQAVDEASGLRERLTDARTIRHWIAVDLVDSEEWAFAWEKGVQTTPCVLLYDGTGRLRVRYSGRLDWPTIEDEIRALSASANRE